MVAIDPGVRTFATYFSDDSCGFVGVEVIKLTNGELVNRDIVGARNILLRALVGTPDCFTVAVN